MDVRAAPMVDDPSHRPSQVPRARGLTRPSVSAAERSTACPWSDSVGTGRTGAGLRRHDRHGSVSAGRPKYEVVLIFSEPAHCRSARMAGGSLKWNVSDYNRVTDWTAGFVSTAALSARSRPAASPCNRSHCRARRMRGGRGAGPFVFRPRSAGAGQIITAGSRRPRQEPGGPPIRSRRRRGVAGSRIFDASLAAAALGRSRLPMQPAGPADRFIEIAGLALLAGG